MPKPVIIDTDPGVDDALALILALRSPELRVEAITTVCGNVPVQQATKNAVRILKILDPAHCPILAKGAEQPLVKQLITAESIHGSDGLGDLYQYRNPDGRLRYPDLEPPELPDATEVLIDLLARFPGELTLISLGPLTNLARALSAADTRIKRLREVVVMGGAIGVPGNITPAAEFNVYVDPQAARAVFSAGLPITLVPLDVTQRIRLNRHELETLVQGVHGPLGQLISDMTARLIAFDERMGEEGVVTLHDPLAVGVAIDSSFVETFHLHVDVETEGRITAGMTLADRRLIPAAARQSPNLQVALEVNQARFLDFFRERLCQR